MKSELSAAALDQLFREARTYNAFLPHAVTDAQLRALYDLAKMAPTSANTSPARIVFVKSPEAKARLAPALSEGNRAKTLAAPVTAIVGTDHAFYEHLPKLFPHADARAWFVGNPSLIDTTAFRNGTLQGAYLIMAARALGLDCGPMLIRKLDFTVVPAKNAASTMALSKPDIGPQSRPSARAAMIR